MFLSCCMSCLTANAQWSLKDVLNKETVGNLAGSLISSKVTAADLVGTWAYSKPACEPESDDAAKKVGGSLVSSQIEAKLAELYAKAGISADRFSVTFNTDSSFVCQLKNRSIGGTFSVDGETGQISLKYGSRGRACRRRFFKPLRPQDGRPYSAAFRLTSCWKSFLRSLI